MRLVQTPGEVMQLPADEELVMVSGAPPIRAGKVRYYEDLRLSGRVLPPPGAAPAFMAQAAPWSQILAPRSEAAEDVRSLGEGGLHRHPDVEMETPEPIGQDTDVGPGALSADRSAGRLAREASLDPDDGIPL